MKKSEAYNLAQQSILINPGIRPANKLAILRILMEDENVALYVERKEEEKAADEQ